MATPRICGAESAEREGVFCRRDLRHAGPHMGQDDAEVVQFVRVMGELLPSESEQTMHAWSMMLPPLGTEVVIGGVDGRNYFDGEAATLDLVIFGDDGVQALRVRWREALAIVPWARVDALTWRADA